MKRNKVDYKKSRVIRFAVVFRMIARIIYEQVMLQSTHRTLVTDQTKHDKRINGRISHTIQAFGLAYNDVA